MTATDRPISQCDLCGRITQVRETYHGTIVCVDNQTCVARRERRPRAGDHSVWPRKSYKLEADALWARFQD